MRYDYCSLSAFQFESLVIHLCYEILGIGTQSFADGRDGGRDSRFDGDADLYPSRTSPWAGLTIIQAKHTISYNKKFSDNDFFGNTTSIINEEIPKIKNLISLDNMKNYLMFSNRRLPADANEKILNFISSETGLQKNNIGLIGIEQMGNYFKKFSSIPDIVGLNPFDMIINIDPEQLAEIIVNISSSLKTLSKKDTSNVIYRVGFDEKNKINGLGESYGKIIKRKIADFSEITEFLAHPDNKKYQEKYIESSEELAAKIFAYKEEHHSFEKVLEIIIELLMARDSDLNKNKKLTRIMVYYMYYHCDIGENHVANA